MIERTNKEGFTLIELLVVIAILALLLAVMLPALNSAKLTAKQVVCAAQMKQWTLAALAYTGENDYALTPFADTCDKTNGGNALNPETYYYNRLSPYLTEEDYGRWGMDDVRRCPMGRAGWGEKAVWIGVYYSKHSPEKAPFVYLNSWNGSTLTKICDPFKVTAIQSPANYLMMLDVRRDHVFNPFHKQWITDYDGDDTVDFI